MATSSRSAAARSGLRSGHSLRALIASGIPPPACGSITITHFHALSGRASGVSPASGRVALPVRAQVHENVLAVGPDAVDGDRPGRRR